MVVSEKIQNRWHKLGFSNCEVMARWVVLYFCVLIASLDQVLKFLRTKHNIMFNVSKITKGVFENFQCIIKISRNCAVHNKYYTGRCKAPSLSNINS